MAEGKDIAWKPIAYCAGTLVLGVIIGTLFVAPSMKKLQEKKKAIPKIKEGTSK